MDKLASYLVREGALPVADAVGWTVRLAAALEVIHRVGVAHGRVSSRAIQFLGPGCEAAGFVLDTDDVTDDRAYQSPERLGGGEPSTDDDTWAVGVVLFEALTGALPFVGASAEQVLAKIAKPSTLSLEARGIEDEQLQTLVRRVFSADPSDRITDLAALREQLVAWDPTMEALPALKLGKPDLAIFQEDDDDDEGEQVTAVVDAPAALLAARRAKAASRPAPPPPKAVPRRKTLKPGDSEFPEGLPVIVPSERPPPPKERPAPTPSPPPLGLFDEVSPEPTPSPPAIGLFDEASPDPPIADATPSPSPLEATAAATPSPPAAAADSARASKSRWPLLLGVGAPLLVLGAAAFVLGTDWLASGTAAATSAPPSAEPAPTASPPATGESTDEPTTLAASATTTSADSPSSTPTATVTAATTDGAPVAATTEPPASAPAPSLAAPAPPPGDLAACVAPLFPPDTFANTTPRLDFLCTQTHSRKGGTALKVEVIRAGTEADGIPEGMQEWAKLGWYEMAVFAIARGRCCTDPAPLATPLGLDLCPLDKTMEELGRAAARGDAPAAKAALEAYTEVVVCLVQAGASPAFGQGARPTKLATEACQTILERALAAAAK